MRITQGELDDVVEDINRRIDDFGGTHVIMDYAYEGARLMLDSARDDSGYARAISRRLSYAEMRIYLNGFLDGMEA